MPETEPTLTEAEQRALFSAYTEDSITALRDVIESVKADAWAAARREALLEAAAIEANGNWQAENGAKYMGLYGRLHQRIQTLADEWGVLPPVGSKRAARTIVKRECSRALLAALAEPERDEEGGRCTELTCPQHGPANRAKEEER